MKLRLLSLAFTFLTLLLPGVRADVVLDNFNTSRSYPECCGEYGSYYSFTSNLAQNGGGTLVIGGAANDNGGVFRGKGSTVLYDLRWQTGLVLRARSLPSNLSTNIDVWLRDWNATDVLYTFPMSSFNTNSFTSLTNDLMLPAFGNATNFDFAHVVSWDILGEFTADERPFGLEVDSLMALGPTVEYGPPLSYAVHADRFDLLWPTGGGAGFTLQSAPTVQGAWTNEPAAGVTNTNYFVAKSLPLTNRFFRLVKELGSSLAGAGGKKNSSQITQSASRKDLELISVGIMAPTKSIELPTNQPIAENSYLCMESYKEDREYRQLVTTNGVASFDQTAFYTWNWSDHTGGVQLLVANFPVPAQESITNTRLWSPLNERWPYGIEYWSYGGSTNYWLQWPEELHRLPYDYIPSLIATTVVTSGSTQTLDFTRMVSVTETELHVGRGGADAGGLVYVALSVVATNIDEMAGNGGFIQKSQIDPDDISVPGSVSGTANADDQVFVQAAARTTVRITPAALGRSNYLYSLKVIQHQTNWINRTYHPSFASPRMGPVPTLGTLRTTFTNGAIVLLQDGDAKIRDANAPASTNASSTYRTDDVPHLCEFRISDGPTNYSPVARALRPVFPAAYQAARFFNIRFTADALALLENYEEAHIKQVKTMRVDNRQIDGYTFTPSKPMNAIFVSDVPPGVAVHEWGHATGLPHRGETNVFGEVNYGPQSAALMKPVVSTSDGEINRWERMKMRNWSLP